MIKDEALLEEVMTEQVLRAVKALVLYIMASTLDTSINIIHFV